MHSSGYLVVEGEDYVVDNDVKVLMRDGTKLSTKLFFPASEGVVERTRTWPCVLIRTPYDKNKINPDMRSPGQYWTQNGYVCAIQDVRGRFGSEGTFVKYVNEGQDGFDCVAWITKQPWNNGSVVTTGISYLAHTQTSMAMYRPPGLKAMFVDKGGFWNAFTSGVRSGGCFEARQLIWALQKQNDKVGRDEGAVMRKRLRFAAQWFKNWPWQRGASPLNENFERVFFDMMENATYDDYWKQIGMNTQEHVKDFADIPAIFFIWVV